MIPATDEGLLRGDGAFEVIKLYEGRPYALRDHLDRLERSAATIELPVDRAALEHEIGDLLGEFGARDGALRIVVTRGGRRVLASRDAARVVRDDRRSDRHLRAERDPRRRQVALLRGEHAGDPDRQPRRAPTRRSSSAPTASCSRPPPPRSSGSRRTAACGRRRSTPASSTRSPAHGSVASSTSRRATAGVDDLLGCRRGLPRLDHARDPGRSPRSTAGDLPEAPGPRTTRHATLSRAARGRARRVVSPTPAGSESRRLRRPWTSRSPTSSG